MSENKPKKSSKKLDEKKLTYIFFGIMAAGLIVFTIILFLHNKAGKTYVASFGDSITTTIELTDEEINMLVSVNGTEINQHGSLSLLEQTDEYSIYEATLEPLSEEDEPEVVQIKVYEDSLILAYESGEVIEYEVK